MDSELERFVRQRARQGCEYCRIPAYLEWLHFQIDHVIALKHGGETAAENLALACFHCNSYKGPNIAGIDPRTGRLVRLYHPRRDVWSEHFEWDGPVLAGRTPIARATIHVLWINHPRMLHLRSALLAEGESLPSD